MNIEMKPAKVWYLELLHPVVEKPDEQIFKALLQQNIAPDNYLKIYREIGGPWNWANRLLMDRKTLETTLNDTANEIYYCYFNKDVAGYFELDCHDSENIELVYFGLSPRFIGKGLGRLMMQNVIYQASRHNTKRLWLHTCEFDAPQALDFYLKSGFSIYKESVEDQPIIT